MSETTTETTITDIDSAINSIIESSEETTEAIIEEEIQDTEEISPESEIEEEVDSEEEITEEEAEATDSEDDDDQIEDASQSEPEMHTVKSNGQELEVTLDDLKRDYGGQKFVQSGMQENAQQKKEVEAVFSALTNERQQLAELYQSLQQGNITAPPEKPTKEMFDADPIGYMKQNLDYDCLLYTSPSPRDS